MQTSQQIEQAKKLNIIAWILTFVVLGLVVMMRRVKIPVDVDLSILPMINAILNTICAVFLVLAYRAIKRKDVLAHRMWIYRAMIASVLFLLCYVAYHFTTEETLYCKEGFSRTIYFILLISHIVLAAVIFPFVLFTFIRAYTGQIEKHKKMAKWVYPIWLYVAISGPLCYLMLAPCYG